MATSRRFTSLTADWAARDGRSGRLDTVGALGSVVRTMGKWLAIAGTRAVFVLQMPKQVSDGAFFVGEPDKSHILIMRGDVHHA